MTDLQDIYKLQAFVTVVEEGSFTAAVKKLHITQPALSSRLKLLETSMNCTLLERTGKGVFPTDIGKIVYKHSLDIIRRLTEMQTTVDRYLQLKEGWVHLAGGATAVFGVFPSAIQNFRLKFPDIQFTLKEINTSHAIQNVRDGVVDLAVVTRNPMDLAKHDDPFSSVTVHRVIVDELTLVASQNNCLAANSVALNKIGKNILPMHLNKREMILPESGSSLRDLLESEFQKLYIKPNIVMTLRSTQNILQMVEKNIGISIVSKLLLNKNPNLQQIKVENMEIKRELVVIGPQGKNLTQAAKKFLDYLSQSFIP